MKAFKKVLCITLALLAVVGLCSCGDSSSDGQGEQSEEQQVRSAVESRLRTAYFGSSIGGNELNSSSGTITNVKQVSDTEYAVSGQIVMTDIYGTKWNNTFDCTVTKRGESWSAGSLEYTSSSWKKG